MHRWIFALQHSNCDKAKGVARLDALCVCSRDGCMYIRQRECFLQHSRKDISALKMDPQAEQDNGGDLDIPIENLVLEGAVGGDPVMDGVLELCKNYDSQLPLNFDGEESPSTRDRVMRSAYDEVMEILGECSSPEKAGKVAALIAKSHQLYHAFSRGDIDRDEAVEEYNDMRQKVPVSVLPEEERSECHCKKLLQELKILLDSFEKAVKIFQDDRKTNEPGLTENLSLKPGYRSGDRFREHFCSFLNELTRLFRDKVQPLWACLVADCSCSCVEREFALSWGNMFNEQDQETLRMSKDRCEQFLIDHTFAFNYYTDRKF